MNKKNLFSLIILDIVVMILAAGLFIYRYRSITSALCLENIQKPTFRNETTAQQRKNNDIEARTLETRNIGFMYRHSRAKDVKIVGDFNDWVPQAMVKGADHKWKITLALEPGEYAYNFIVDGKPLRDPNNQKICDAGKGYPNSYLKVKSIEEEKSFK